MPSQFPSFVSIFEVGPRDGLQNEKSPVSLQSKVELVNQLSSAGVQKIEAGSFVSPKWVPQMANSAEVFSQINRSPGVSYSALIPNIKGMEMAIASGADEVAIFAAASETFSQKNVNCSIAESLDRFKPIMEMAASVNKPVRGYVSCVAGCPYEGEVLPHKVAQVTKSLMDLGCYEVSLGDTIGVGTPKQIQAMITEVAKLVPVSQLAVHFHDTYGQALTNIYASLAMGISVVDSAVAGLGGCPYASCSTDGGAVMGNVATEDVLYMLNGMGIKTGIDLNKVILAGNAIAQQLGRPSNSKVALAGPKEQ